TPGLERQSRRQRTHQPRCAGALRRREARRRRVGRGRRHLRRGDTNGQRLPASQGRHAATGLSRHPRADPAPGLHRRQQPLHQALGGAGEALFPRLVPDQGRDQRGGQPGAHPLRMPHQRRLGHGLPERQHRRRQLPGGGGHACRRRLRLNLIWLQQSKIEQFVREVLDHIGGVLTTSPSTGRFVLKLVRANYAVASLPVLDPTNVIELESFQRAAWGETTNELVLIYTKSDTFKETSITVQDLANIQAQGAVVSQTRRYPGITSDALAARVAMRDLAAVSTPLAKVRLKVN